MAFEGLTEKISATFKKLRGKGRLKETDVKEAMREIRMALLEADVSYKVCKDFTKSVTERCVGADVLESLTPAQMIVKIVNAGDKSQDIVLNLNGLTKKTHGGTLTTYASDSLDADNSFDEPTKLIPQSREILVEGAKIEVSIPAKSFAMYKIRN